MITSVPQRRFLPVILAALALALTPRPALAEVSGSCDAVGVAGSSPAVAAALRAGGDGPGVSIAQLGSATGWPVPGGSSLGILESASLPVHRLTGQALLFGVPVHDLGSWGSTQTHGTMGPWAVSGVAGLSRVLGLRARGDGCSGSVALVIDESPLDTLLGGVALAAALLGGAAAAFAVWRRRRQRLLLQRLGTAAQAAAAGLLAGLGAGLFLQETEALSPLDVRDLAVPAAGLVAGVLAGMLAAPIALRQPAGAGRRASGTGRKVLLAGAVIGLLAACAPGAMGINLTRASTVITPARAADVTRIYWDANNRAAAAADAGQRAPLETGVLQHATLHHLAGLRVLGVGLPPAPLRNLRVYVPRQSAYPAIFAVALDTDQQQDNGRLQPERWYLLFTRATAAAPWLATMLAIAPEGGRSPRFAVAPDGYAAAWSPARSRPAIGPGQLSAAYAAYVTQGVTAGRPGAVFAPGPLTDQHLSDLRIAFQRNSEAGAATVLEARPMGPWYAFAGADGSPIVFFEVSDSYRFTTQPPHCLGQQPGQQFDPLLAPGKYRSVSELVADQILAVDGSRSVDLVGTSIQRLATTGERGSGCV